MEIFHYDPISFELLGSSQAKLDPIESTPMVPAHATPTAPPAVAEGMVAVYNPEQDTWSETEDSRGVEYWDSDNLKHTVKSIGESVPVNASLYPRPTDNHVLVGSDWEESLELVLKRYEQAVEIHINEVAASKGYNTIDSIAKYLVDGNPFKTEAEALSLWTGQVWVSAQTQLNDWQNGGDQPTIEEVIAALPPAP